MKGPFAPVRRRAAVPRFAQAAQPAVAIPLIRPSGTFSLKGRRQWSRETVPPYPSPLEGEGASRSEAGEGQYQMEIHQ